MTLDEIFSKFSDETKIKRKNQILITDVKWAKGLKAWGNEESRELGFIIPQFMIDDAMADDSRCNSGATISGQLVHTKGIIKMKKEQVAKFIEDRQTPYSEITDIQVEGEFISYVEKYDLNHPLCPIVRIECHDNKLISFSEIKKTSKPFFQLMYGSIPDES